MGATDGVFDASGAVVQRIGAANREELLESVGGSAAEDVTGGMRLRLETACRLADHGVSSWIGNGLVPGRLQEALAGAEVPGTTVEASR